MASKGVELGGLLVLLMMLCHGATAQSGCTAALVGLVPCLSYVTGNSTTPSSSCCSQLPVVVQSQPQCLCAMLNGGGSSFGININETLAQSLPGACNVQTPPVSQCNAANNGPATSPVGSPSSTPADSSDDTLETPNAASMPSIPAGGGSKTVDGTSAASITSNQPHLTIFIIFIASSCTSNVIRF